MAGIKGKSGRKSKYQELANAERLHQLYLNPINQEELEEKIRSGKFSIEDRQKLNAMEGDSNIINRIFQKVYPDNVDLKSDGKALPQPLLNVIQNHVSDKEDTRAE